MSLVVETTAVVVSGEMSLLSAEEEIMVVVVSKRICLQNVEGEITEVEASSDRSSDRGSDREGESSTFLC